MPIYDLLLQESEIPRVVDLCNPQYRSRSPYTFLSVEGCPVGSWQIWQATVFRPLLEKRMLNVLAHGRSLRAREIRELDRELEELLPEPGRRRSRTSGRALLKAFKAPRSEKILSRLRRWVDSGKTPGHFPVIYAARCAVFSIPPRMLLLSYLYQEWETGGRRLRPGLSFSRLCQSEALLLERPAA